MSYPLSCMNIEGKTFCCKKCDKKITVEYEGGARPTFLSTEEAQLQLGYSENLQQPDHITPVSGFYLYEFGLCATCYESTVTARDIDNTKDAYALYDQLLDKRQQFIDALAPRAVELIDQVSSEITLDDIHGVIGHPVDITFGDKYATHTKQIRLIHVFIQKYSYKIQELIKKKVFAEGFLLKSLKQYREETLPQTIKIKSLLPASLTKFVLKRTNDPENVSCFDFVNSVRNPTNSLPDEIFYGEYSVGWGLMLSSVGVRLANDLCFHEMINKALCNKIMIRLAAQGA